MWIGFVDDPRCDVTGSHPGSGTNRNEAENVS